MGVEWHRGLDPGWGGPMGVGRGHVWLLLVHVHVVHSSPEIVKLVALCRV